MENWGCRANWIFSCCVGEKVLCFHGPMIYEAKMLKSSIMKDKQVKYFVHYAGWNKKYVSVDERRARIMTCMSVLAGTSGCPRTAY